VIGGAGMVATATGLSICARGNHSAAENGARPGLPTTAGREEESPLTPMIPASEALLLQTLITPTEQGIASRVLAKAFAGSVTLFAFDAAQGLSEHTSPFEALVFVLDGNVTLTIGGTPVHAMAGTITRMPANVPHSVDAVEAARLLLIMLRQHAAA
jgi:quercetin dioxygenase-like cupin family protein